MFVVVASALTACSGGAGGDTAASASQLTLAQGPDVCFRAVVKQLTADAKVVQFVSRFSAGTEIESTDTAPQGQLTECMVTYQDPADRRKLLRIEMDPATGSFGAPMPVEIKVSGDASGFKLDDQVISLTKLNVAGLAKAMETQKPRLDKTMSRYAWTVVQLYGDGTRDFGPDGYVLRLDVVGRVAGNDVQKRGYMTYSVNADRVVSDYLLTI